MSKLCDDVEFTLMLIRCALLTWELRKWCPRVLENKDCVAFNTQRQVVASEATWHYRLPHTDLKVLQKLHFSKVININKSRTTTLCEPCQMGKRTRLQFFSSSSHVSKPLEMIHCDLWGPSPVVSIQGFKYNVVFIDEFSRYTWLYPLHTNLISSLCSRCFKQWLRINLTPQLKNFRVMEEVNLPVTCWRNTSQIEEYCTSCLVPTHQRRMERQSKST